MKQKKLHTTFLFILMWSFLFSQEYKNYTIKDGLPSNHVYRITQDYKGFIWIITDKGISKFDGNTFKNFTVNDGLPTNDIWNIKITQDNKIWYFSKANALGYILEDKIYAFPSTTNKVMYPRIILQAKNSIKIDDGRLEYVLKDSIWQPSPNQTGNNLYWTKQKVIHRNIKYHSLNQARDSFFLFKKNKKISLSVNTEVFNTVYSHGQANDSLYIYSSRLHYTIENLNRETIQHFSYTSQSLKKEVNYFRYHNVNNQVQFTGMDFVSCLGNNGALKNTVRIPKRLNAHFSFIDKTGNVWSATFNKGVFMLPKVKRQVKILGKDKKVQFLKLINNTLYAGIYKEGFYRLSDTLRVVRKNNGFQYSIVAIDKLQAIFFSSEYDIYSYKNKKMSVLDVSKETLPKEVFGRNTFARKLIEFNGALYGNNSFGFRKIDPKDFTLKKRYLLYGVSSFSKNQSQLFIGNPSGLFALKNDSLVKLKSSILFDRAVLSQAKYNTNQVVVGTDGYGAYITNGKTAKLIAESDHLSIRSIFVDSNNSIWLATQKGAYKVLKTNNRFAIVASFFESDGLLSNSVNSIAVKNDSLFVATDLGISVLSLNQKRINQLQRVYIKSVSMNGSRLNKDTISFLYKNNSLLSISFGAIDFNNHQNLKYQYKLKPVQKRWIESNIPEINFSELPPKTYTLTLKVSNHHKKSYVNTITVHILPLWYQTWVFKTTVFLLVLMVLYFFNQWNKKNIEKTISQRARVNQKLAEQELYALRSQMNPHFVFNSLNAIQYYITKNEIALSEKYLVKFARLVRMFFDFSAKKTIALQEEIALLKGYLEIEKMRFGDDFRYVFTIDKDIDLKTHIPTMLLQPIVENAVNHGIFHNNKKGTVTVLIEFISKNEYKITISDNGVGFKKAQEIKANSIKKHLSRSTRMIKDRIELINQFKKWKITQETLHLKRNAITGTSVVLTFKRII